MQSTKNQIIAKKGRETRLRHRGMSVKVFEVKVLKNHLNADTLERGFSLRQSGSRIM